jgi:diguanylate cyclase (GGDEF)-like protein
VLALPSVVLPGSVIATACYLAGLLVLAAALVTAARSLPTEHRRIWSPWILGVGIAISGSAAWQISALPAAPLVLADVALVCWLAFYLPITRAVLRMIEGRDLPSGVRQAIAKDVAVATIAAAVFAWYVLIEPSLAGAETGGGWAVFAAFCFPLGDVVLVGLALTVLMVPGRRTVSEHLIVAGLSVSLLADVGNALLPTSAVDANAWYMPTYLMVNAMLTTAALHPSRVTPILAAGGPQAPQGMRRWRMALLGTALCAVGLSTIALPEQGWDRVPATGAMLTMITVILSRLYRAVTDLEKADRLLRHQATHDQLTGLANRARLLHDMRDAVRASPTLFFVDLDGFKGVNDTYGHHCGDLVLRAVAARLTSIVRHTDTVARLGGDEFVVCCTGLTDPDVTALSDRLQTALTEPIDVGDCSVTIGASIGILTLPPTTPLTEQNADELISKLLSTADAAMYEAKRSGGGTRIADHLPVG